MANIDLNPYFDEITHNEMGSDIHLQYLSMLIKQVLRGAIGAQRAVK